MDIQLRPPSLINAYLLTEARTRSPVIQNDANVPTSRYVWGKGQSGFLTPPRLKAYRYPSLVAKIGLVKACHNDLWGLSPYTSPQSWPHENSTTCFLSLLIDSWE